MCEHPTKCSMCSVSPAKMMAREINTQHIFPIYPKTLSGRKIQMKNQTWALIIARDWPLVSGCLLVSPHPSISWHSMLWCSKNALETSTHGQIGEAGDSFLGAQFMNYPRPCILVSKQTLGKLCQNIWYGGNSSLEAVHTKNHQLKLMGKKYAMRTVSDVEGMEDQQRIPRNRRKH